jgi:hypothetical protein
VRQQVSEWFHYARQHPGQAVVILIVGGILLVGMGVFKRRLNIWEDSLVEKYGDAAWAYIAARTLSFMANHPFYSMGLLLVAVILGMFGNAYWVNHPLNPRRIVLHSVEHLDVQLTPSSGPSAEVMLAALNRANAREFSAQCTLLALRNSPNELSRRTFNLKWEHTFERDISITKGESQNLLVATAHPNHRDGFTELEIWGLSANQLIRREGSRWNLDSREALPEYDLEIRIVSEGAEPYSEQFTLRPRTWFGPLEMVRIMGA